MKFIFEIPQQDIKRIYGKTQPEDSKKDVNSKEERETGEKNSTKAYKPVTAHHTTATQASSQQHAGEITTEHKATTDTEDTLYSYYERRKKDEPNQRRQENTVSASKNTTARPVSARQTAVLPQPARRLNVRAIVGIFVGLAIVLAIALILFVYNPSIGRRYTGEVYSTRLNKLCDKSYNWLYAKSFDFDKDGVNEIFFLNILKNEDNEESIYYGLLKEGEDDIILHPLEKDSLNIPYGIYAYNGKYFTGMPSLYSNSSSDTGKATFAFRESASDYKKGEKEIYLIEDANDNRLSQFKLVYAFPFNNDTSDYSQFKSTVKDEIELLRKEYKK